MNTTYTCCQDKRLRVVKEAGQLNGIEYLEVAPVGPRQRTLLVRLLKAASGITRDQVTIDDGERIRTVGVEWVAAADALPAGEDPGLVSALGDPQNVLVVRTDQPGDFSYYTLHLTSPGFDPVLDEVEFSFKVDCDASWDCRDKCHCNDALPASPQLDYLAKDYASFRRMLLDRLSLVSPRWRERNPADLGVALVELLAYEADRLSYRQDAIATEAYLGTARSRVSLRRHARLVDYRLHDGCSARVLLRCTSEGDGVVLAAGTKVYSKVDGLKLRLDADGERAALNAGAAVFETVDRFVLYEQHNELYFYTWGDDECCLPEGSMAATLRGEHPDLKSGDVLIVREVRSPASGKAADADPAHTWAVRLTKVEPSSDPSGGRFLPVPDDNPVAVTEIAWDRADRLPFPVCVSAKAAGPDPVSVAWGNVVVADHGRSTAEQLGEVPQPHLFYAAGAEHCGSEQLKEVTARFRPALRHRPLSQRVDVNPRLRVTTDLDAGVAADLSARAFTTTVKDWLISHGVTFEQAPVTVRGAHDEWSVSDGVTVVRVRAEAGKLSIFDRPVAAAAVTAATPRGAQPQITLDDGTRTWRPRWDLLGSADDAEEFAVEAEHDGTAYLRLNNPASGLAFTATYRVGNGVAGNVGAGTLVHIATAASVTAVTNPLPAAGGHEPESGDEVRRDAAQAYLVQERAVTPADWAEVAIRDEQVQRAAATWRWTGSWHTVFLTVDRFGGRSVDAAFEQQQRARLEKYRLAGYDLELDAPRFVPIELGVHVCIGPGHARSAVRRELLKALTALFHADRLTFAQPVYLSPVYAAAQAVPGVSSVTVHTFRRQHDPGVTGVADGVLAMSRLEIARLDSNPSFPEHGVLELTLGGGH
jgi:hypothetical protein